MKKILIFLVLLLSGTTAFSASSNFPPYFVKDNVSGAPSFSSFSIKSPDISFDAPANWERKDQALLQKIYKDQNRHYLWRGQKNSVFGSGYSALIMTVAPKNALNSLNDYSIFLLKERLPKGGQIIKSGEIELAGRKAYETEIRYKSLLGTGSYPAPVSFRKVIWFSLEKDNFFVDLRYTAEETDFEKYLPVYQKAKESLR